MKKSLNLTIRGQKSKKKRVRINAITIWLGIEIIAVLIMAAAVMVHGVNGKETGTEPTYRVPAVSMMSENPGDIELPVDFDE